MKKLIYTSLLFFCITNNAQIKSIAQESVEKSGQMGIPVIDIDGQIIIGFDRPKIDTVLKDKKLV
jgi:hypothetical protein